jgi:glycosyltransferase involved in cell wall biosynthesis
MRSPHSFGVNVIGHISGNLGQGVTARSVVATLLQKGINVSLYDVDPGLGRFNHDRRFQQHTVQSVHDLPYDVNLFIFDPITLSQFFAYDDQSLILRERCLNAVLTFWELATLSSPLESALGLCDVVITDSEFNRYTIATNVSDVFSISSKHFLEIPTGVSPDRAKFGLPRDKVVFVCSFEPHSDPQRKNPRAVIDAFKRAFPNGSRALLLLKLNNATLDGKAHPVIEEINEWSAGHNGIRIMTDRLTYTDVIQLYASCDVFVSLHRSEGLGLSLMEAMVLGKPVIATAWSGNMSFMNHNNSCLVGYELIPVEASIDAYRRSNAVGQSCWADPDVEQAAKWMEKLAGDESYRLGIGNRAAECMRRYQEEARQASFIDELRAIRDSQMHNLREMAVKRGEIERLRKLLSTPEPTFLGRTRRNLKNVLERHLLWRFRRQSEVATATR